jgi:hypothetical protein
MKIWQDSIIVVQLGNRAKIFVQNIGFLSGIENILSQVIVTEQEVIDMLCTLNANKAVGPDIISNRMLVSVKEEISKPFFRVGD